jgi:hypothetical protein
MRTTKVAFDVVRELAAALPGVEESTMYGSPALKLRGKMLACMATNKAADPDSLVVQVGFVNRDLLVVKDPKTYYLRKHYEGYPVVLVRLSVIARDELREILEMAHRHVSATPKRRGTKTRRPRAT